jgi:hypothetical protein
MASSSIFQKMRSSPVILSNTSEANRNEFSAQEIEPEMAYNQVTLSNNVPPNECDNGLHSSSQYEQHTSLINNEVIDNDPIENVDFHND